MPVTLLLLAEPGASQYRAFVDLQSFPLESQLQMALHIL